MKTHKWMLFTHPVMDLKAAEAALNRAAEEGWTLDRVVWGCFARLVPAQAPEVWAVDWSDGTHLEREDYLALCADAGWTFVQKVRSFQLYKAPAGTTPIQTDSAVELSRFREEELRRLGKVVRSYAVLWLFLALVVGGFALLFSLRSAPANLLLSLSTSNTLVYLLLCLPLLLAGLAAWTARLCLRLAQWRRAAAEEAPFPVPGPRSAGAAAWLCLLFRVWVFSLFPLLLLDFSQLGNIGTPLGFLIGVGIAVALCVHNLGYFIAFDGSVFANQRWSLLVHSLGCLHDINHLLIQRFPAFWESFALFLGLIGGLAALCAAWAHRIDFSVPYRNL